MNGCNGVIGEGITRGFASIRSDSIIAARKPENTTEAVGLMKEEFGSRVFGVQLDVANEELVCDISHQAVEALGRIGILVNNAGINIRRMPQDYLTFKGNRVLISDTL